MSFIKSLFICVRIYVPVSKRVTGDSGMDVCVFVCMGDYSVMAKTPQLSFSDADRGYKFITLRSRQPIIPNTGSASTQCAHLCVHVFGSVFVCVFSLQAGA